MVDTPFAEARIREAARNLVGASVRSVWAAKSGGNSRIFRVETPAGPFALKSYPMRRADTERNRAEVEWKTLCFLTSRGVTAVPAPLARDAAGEFLLMEWIDGVPLEAYTTTDLAHAADFITKIFGLSFDAEAVSFSLASEACLSTATIIRQIEHRLVLFAPEPTLETFLARKFFPIFDAAKSSAGSDSQQNIELARHLQRLIPADFGFHNVLRQRHLPLFALRWVLILFNPFRRDRADELPHDDCMRQALLNNRLAKARVLFEWTKTGAMLGAAGA